MNLNRIREKTIENSKKIIEVQIGALSLVAMKQVTIKIPVPYTALKAEKSINERKAGDLERRAKNDSFCVSSMYYAVAFPSKYSVLPKHYID